MPGGLLRCAAQRGEFREVAEPAALFQYREASARRHGLGCPFFPFTPHPFQRQLGKRVGDGSAQCGGLRSEGEVEAPGELHPAEHAQRILGKGRAGVSEHARFQISLPAVGVDDFAGEGIARDRVDREIAPRRRLRVAECRIGCDGKAPVAGAGLGFAAWQGEIVVFARFATANFDHAKTAPHDIGRAKSGQRAMQGLEIHPAHFDIEVFRRESQQPIAHAAADEPRPANAPHRVEHRAQIGRKVEFGSCGHAAFFSAAAAANSHPSTNSEPPSGGTVILNQSGACALSDIT